MKVRSVLLFVVMTCIALAAAPALAGPDDAAAKFASGKALLAKADFDGALQAFTAAAKADSENQQYAQQVALLRQVIKLRASLDKADDSPKWLNTAESLHAFYVDNKIYTEALALDRKMYAKAGTGEAAARLARTELTMGQNSEAVELLRNLPAEQVTFDTRALLGLALARQGQADEARKLAAELKPQDDASASQLLDLACLNARVNQPDQAAALLTRYFESTPPSQLDAAKAAAKESSDLAPLRGTSGFAKALAAESKVAESKCSMGPSCGKCPKSKTCAATEGEKKDEAGCKDHPKSGDDQP